MTPLLEVHTLINGPIEENCYVLVNTHSRHALIVDPGCDASDLIGAIKKLKVEPELIVATHGHFDHVGAVEFLKKEF
jgi:hydroxyacylglutathione hydrolase